MGKAIIRSIQCKWIINGFEIRLKLLDSVARAHAHERRGPREFKSEWCVCAGPENSNVRVKCSLVSPFNQCKV